MVNGDLSIMRSERASLYWTSQNEPDDLVIHHELHRTHHHLAVSDITNNSWRYPMASAGPVVLHCWKTLSGLCVYSWVTRWRLWPSTAEYGSVSELLACDIITRQLVCSSSNKWQCVEKICQNWLFLNCQQVATLHSQSLNLLNWTFSHIIACIKKMPWKYVFFLFNNRM